MSEQVLLTAYEQAITEKLIQRDQQQVAALNVLQQVRDELLSVKPSFFGFGKKEVKGAYLYGKVGTGKTFLMDLFYQNLPLENKIRMHFYKFMEMIHARLKPLQNQKNPLKIVAKEIAENAKVICFDEFFVTNIVDAMLLGNLLQALYQEGITLVATSNVVPDELYKDGLQRDQFLPAIDLLKKNNHVIQVDSGKDYRLDKADYDRAYYHPQDPEMRDMLFSRFKSFADSAIQFNKEIIINERDVATLYNAENAIWFDFKVLCGVPRSQADYLWLSDQYNFVFMSGLRKINRHENDLISNFIKLIDVFYDVKTKLIILADIGIKEIYTEGMHRFEFDRTESRLFEMQSEGYLKRKDQDS